jgi:hypothetical protein
MNQRECISYKNSKFPEVELTIRVQGLFTIKSSYKYNKKSTYKYNKKSFIDNKVKRVLLMA